MPDGIDLKRIIDLDPETTVTEDDYTIVDSTNGGAKKFAIGQALGEIKDGLTAVESDVTDLKEDIGDLSDLETGDKSSVVAAINEAAQSGGSGGITVVDAIAEMVDTEAVYLYNGTETGYTAGHWYFYNIGTSAWTDGGQYTGWETVNTALENFLNENAQEMGTLTINVGSASYTYNGSANVSITMPVYNGGVS